MRGFWWAVVSLFLMLELPAGAAGTIVISPRVHHLGTAGDPEWEEFAGSTPEGRGIEFRFEAGAATNETTLLFRQQDVKGEWGVELNGKRLGRLFQMEADLVQALAIPPGLLREGTNTLALVPPKERDDIRFGPVGVDPRPVQAALNEVSLTLRAVDAATQGPLPCRFTIVDEDGPLFPPAVASDQGVAVRPGVIYSGTGMVSLGLRAGNYTIYASRGPEYSVARQRVSLQPTQRLTYRFALEREVSTEGWVAADLHVHTATHSGHGDATVEERMLTLAGEGIEVAVATDHNTHTDYRAALAKTGLAGRFTPVIGNEVTTAAGHFNIWPVAEGARVADFRITDWPRLMAAMRSVPGVEVVVLNHPRNVHDGFQPFGPAHFHPVTGENRRGFEFTFDAVEVLSSSAMQSDWMVNFRDWFALLNHGYRTTAVGVSDGHDVSRYIVGQGRTYVRVADGDPGRVDVGEFARQVKAGRCVVSLGLLAQMTVDDRWQVGDLATGLGELLRVTVVVTGPSWVRADRVELYANGVLLRSQEVDAPVSPVEKTRVTWIVPRPAHDVQLVAIASGPGVTEGFWALAKPYQPSSKSWSPRVVGATNPIWVDGDGDGRFSAAREYARRVVESAGGDAGKVVSGLAGHDEATAAQAAGLCRARGIELGGAGYEAALRQATLPVRRGLEAGGK